MSIRNRRFGFGKDARHQAKKRRSLEGVRLQIEPLEDRRVLATVLEGITTNEGNLLDLQAVDTLQTSPSELTLVFQPGDDLAGDLDGITLSRGGPDQVLGTSDDVAVQTGFVGLGDSANKVIVRFAESLPDDNYEIRVAATVLPSATTVRFNVDLGARVVGVVPQPVIRLSSGELSQQRDQIIVYFNNDDLAPDFSRNTGLLPADLHRPRKRF